MQAYIPNHKLYTLFACRETSAIWYALYQHFTSSFMQNQSFYELFHTMVFKQLAIV